MNKKVEIIEKKIIDEFKHIPISQAIISIDNRVPVYRTKVERPEAVAILIKNKDTNKFIFVKQFRYPIFDELSNRGGEIIEIPAGKVDDGETPLQAVIRETREEVGYFINSGDVKYVLSFYPGVGYSSEKVYVYYVEVTEDERREYGGGIEDEFLETIEMDVEEALELNKKNFFQDGKTILALNYYERH